jgi:hypothetical protein
VFFTGNGISFSLSGQGVFPGLEGLCDTFRSMLESFLALHNRPRHIVANLGSLPVYQVLGVLRPPRKERTSQANGRTEPDSQEKVRVVVICHNAS